MKHEYFKGIDFDNLPTYSQAISELTPYETVVSKVCKYLIQKFANVHKETVEGRSTIFKREVIPYLKNWTENCNESRKQEIQKLIEVIGAQTEIMINLHDDLNIGFTELYKKLRNIQEPVIVKQLNE